MNDATVVSSEAFLHDCLLLDIETNENNRIYAVGSVFRGRQLHFSSGNSITKEQLQEIDCLAVEARYVLGHNILAHDLQHLKAFHPGLRLLRMPVIDTLYLSPLAFPENPYHRLVKDYKIVRDSINNPAQDAALAGRIFSEQWDAFAGQLQHFSDVPIFYRSFMQRFPVPVEDQGVCDPAPIPQGKS
jgi:ATP-dependent DNA helicase RecQ